MQRAMLCKAGKGRASEAVWEYPSPNKENEGVRGKWWGTLGSLAALHQLLPSMLSTFQASTAFQTSNPQIRHDAFWPQRRKATPRWLWWGQTSVLDFWYFPSLFLDFFLGRSSPTINIYVLKTLTNNLSGRLDEHPTYVLEVLRTEVVGLRFWRSCWTLETREPSLDPMSKVWPVRLSNIFLGIWQGALDPWELNWSIFPDLSHFQK